MFDDQVVRVQSLVLGVALRVLEELQQELGGLERPPALGGPVHLGLGVTADSPHEPPEGDDLLVGHNILQILRGAVERHRLDGLGCLAGVLEVNPQVGALGLGGLGGVVRLNSVTSHGDFCKGEFVKNYLEVETRYHRWVLVQGLKI